MGGFSEFRSAHPRHFSGRVPPGPNTSSKCLSWSKLKLLEAFHAHISSFSCILEKCPSLSLDVRINCSFKKKRVQFPLYGSIGRPVGTVGSTAMRYQYIRFLWARFECSKYYNVLITIKNSSFKNSSLKEDMLSLGDEMCWLDDSNPHCLSHSSTHWFKIRANAKFNNHSSQQYSFVRP